MILAAMVLLTACVSPPAGVKPVSSFDAARYMGKWYEIARLDHFFERGLTNVTATYRVEANGKISVQNCGFDQATGRWREVDGVGEFIGPADVGSLKVKVGAPFFGGYHVIAIDRRDYRYAMVSGPTRDYLWILSRKPTLAPAVRARLVAQARDLGFATDSLIFVSQAPPTTRTATPLAALGNSDAAREYAYGREDKHRGLDEATAKGRTVVRMKDD